MNCTMRIIRLRELYYACSTIFFREVRCKTGRVVREADPYGSVIDGALGRGDVGIGPYGEHCMKCGEAGRRGRRPLRKRYKRCNGRATASVAPTEII